MRSHLVVVVLLVALALSVSANVILFRFARRFYVELCSVRLDPHGLALLKPVPVAPGSGTIVLFGDSRAAHWGTPDLQTGWRVVNRGISGQTTAQILGRLEGQVIALDPDLVVIEAGMNDLKTVALFPERRSSIVRQCIENIETMVGRVRESGAHVILVTIFPVGDVPLHRRPFVSSDVDRAVREVNERLRALAGEDVTILDADPFFLAPDGRLHSKFSRDMLHINPEGYDLLNTHLIPLARRILERRKRD